MTAGAHRMRPAVPQARPPLLCGELLNGEGFVCTRVAGHSGAHLEPLTREVLERPEWRTHTGDDWAWPVFANWVCVSIMLMVAGATLGALWVAGLVPW